MRKVMTAAAATIALASMQASAAEVKIDDLIVAKTISDAQRETELKAAEGFYRPHAPARPSAGSAGPGLRV